MVEEIEGVIVELESKIRDLVKKRDEYVIVANQIIASFNGGIRELEQLLVLLEGDEVEDEVEDKVEDKVEE